MLIFAMSVDVYCVPYGSKRNRAFVMESLYDILGLNFFTSFLFGFLESHRGGGSLAVAVGVGVSVTRLLTISL